MDLPLTFRRRQATSTNPKIHVCYSPLYDQLLYETSVAKAFFDRLGNWYLKFGESLTKNSESASIFPNASDRGSNRQVNYLSLLNAILPFGCRPVLGGFLFGSSGVESGQIDIAIITTATPRFNLPNAGSTDKTFAPVDGTIGVVSSKSHLSKSRTRKGFNAIRILRGVL